MISLQILSKIINTKDYSIISDNELTEAHFVGFENEFKFIKEHYEEYGNIPDSATFIAKFPDFEFVEVAESDRYLVDTINEEYLYYKTVPVIQKMAELLKTNSNMAAEYLIKELPNLQPVYSTQGVDIVCQADKRLEALKDKLNNRDNWFFTTGFEELDDITGGLQRGEELCVLFARINQGKSWILEKMATHIWQIGFNVGYISPEMTDNSIGYRFDTLYNNFSNKSLTWGKELELEQYEDYINELKQKQNKFIVATPSDFAKKITVTKLRNFVKQNDLHLLCIDGITYLTDERQQRGDNKTTTLTNISEDLMSLSIELKIPIIVVVQSNRGGVIEQGNDGSPELEHIKDSDGIGANASKVISIRQRENNVLELGIKKQRNGAVGGVLKYVWNIDTGEFSAMPSYDDAQSKEKTERKVQEVKKQYKDKEDIF